jgi:hypothetical protein
MLILEDDGEIGWRDSGHVLLHPDHPYVRNFHVSVYPVAGEWKVKWHDFLSCGQDTFFSTERAARAFAKEVEAKAPIVDLNILDDACTSFDEAEAFWLEGR